MVMLPETLLCFLIMRTSINKPKESVLWHAFIGELDRSATPSSNQTITSLTDALSRFQDINNPNSPRTSQGSLVHMDGYVPALIPATCDFRYSYYPRIRQSVGRNDFYQTTVLVLEESLIHIDRIVLASFETVKMDKHFDVAFIKSDSSDQHMSSICQAVQILSYLSAVYALPVKDTQRFKEEPRFDELSCLFQQPLILHVKPPVSSRVNMLPAKIGRRAF
ncbi:hypothetical protein BDR26DRAFT_54255 [Obelidium mucronatum]|nr:hypothetical protein BDR26DRAFT_54255 [Obelidium mucronatum]